MGNIPLWLCIPFLRPFIMYRNFPAGKRRMVGQK